MTAAERHAQEEQERLERLQLLTEYLEANPDATLARALREMDGWKMRQLARACEEGILL
jgi:hypothetical protein